MARHEKIDISSLSLVEFSRRQGGRGGAVQGRSRDTRSIASRIEISRSRMRTLNNNNNNHHHHRVIDAGASFYSESPNVTAKIFSLIPRESEGEGERIAIRIQRNLAANACRESRTANGELVILKEMFSVLFSPRRMMVNEGQRANNRSYEFLSLGFRKRAG